MEALVAGAIAGYVMAMLTSVAVAYVVFGARDAEVVERWIARDVSGPILFIPILTGSVLAWVFVGLVAAIIYEVADLGAQPDGLGSPSAAFTIVAVVFSLAPALLLGILWPRLWWMWVGLALPCLALFGWLLPHLAGR
ncbi:MAG: hypothetical protein F4152_07570 [Dehalococcoidia bacterium]|nr:hypothetical protein [Chloroflexota bacterium]MYH68390.1 hypothetical protein [Dehalococcoidia bacterium]